MQLVDEATDLVCARHCICRHVQAALGFQSRAPGEAWFWTHAEVACGGRSGFPLGVFFFALRSMLGARVVQNGSCCREVLRNTVGAITSLCGA